MKSSKPARKSSESFVEGGDPCIRNIKKIFVGGISVTTTKSKLMDYFKQFGTIIDCIIMADRDHSKWHFLFRLNLLLAVEPRGFGFVTFEHIDSVNDILDETEHYIDGKLVECKQAVPKDAVVAEVTKVKT